MAQGIRLDGFAELEETLTGLSNATFAKSIVRASLRKAAKPLIQSARAKVMGYSPTVGKSITVNYESKDGATIAIGPKRKNDKLVYLSGDLAMFAAGTGRNPWFAHFIEFGTSGIGRFKKKGRTRYREDQPARPFMRPAFEETKEEMMENFKTSVWESITKYLNKKLKK